MNRREFITFLGGAAIARPIAARAQQRERMRQIGMLLPFVESDVEAQLRVDALKQTLQELGWAEGHNFRIDYRWTGNDADHIRSVALLKRKVQPEPTYSPGSNCSPQVSVSPGGHASL